MLHTLLFAKRFVCQLGLSTVIVLSRTIRTHGRVHSAALEGTASPPAGSTTRGPLDTTTVHDVTALCLSGSLECAPIRDTGTFCVYISDSSFCIQFVSAGGAEPTRKSARVRALPAGSGADLYSI